MPTVARRHPRMECENEVRARPSQQPNADMEPKIPRANRVYEAVGNSNVS